MMDYFYELVAWWGRFYILVLRRKRRRVYTRWVCMNIRRVAGKEMDRFYYVANEAADIVEGRKR